MIKKCKIYYRIVKVLYYNKKVSNNKKVNNNKKVSNNKNKEVWMINS